MIKYSDLVTALQSAAGQAAHAVSQENLQSLRSYFHPIVPDGIDPIAPYPLDFEQLTPRTVSMMLPKITDQGPQEHEIHVPLMLLAPISNVQLTEMEVEMDLEVLEQDGELVIGFPRQSTTGTGDKTVNRPVPNTKVKLKVSPEQKSGGLPTLYEGYDKALRAQLPS